MTSFSQKTILKSYKRRIKKKIDDVVEESDNVCLNIQEITLKLKKKTDDLLMKDDDTFSSGYNSILKDIDRLSEKLFMYIDFFTDSAEDVSPTESKLTTCPEVSVENDLQEIKVPLKTASTTPTDVELPVNAPSSDSGIFFKCPSNTTEELTDNSKDCVSPESSQSLDDNEAVTEPKAICDHQTQEVDTSLARSEKFTFLESLSNTSLHVTSCELNSCEKELPNENPSKLSHESLQYSSRHTNSSASSLSVCSSLHHQTTIKQSVDHCNFTIPDQIVPRGTVLTAVITKFNSPSDFWIQLENTTVEDYLSSQKLHSFDVSCIESIKYCVAPFQQEGYRRAKILSARDDGHNVKVEVLYIDYGNTDIVQAYDLMVFPEALSRHPPQAIHCFLDGVVPSGGEWSPEALEEFDKAAYSDLRAVVLYQENKQLAVQLLMTMQMPEGVETWDFAEMLCLLQLATPTRPSSKLTNRSVDNEPQGDCIKTCKSMPSSSHQVYSHSYNQPCEILNTGLTPDFQPKISSVPGSPRSRLNSDSLSLDGDEDEIYLSDESDNLMLTQCVYPEAQDQNAQGDIGAGCDVDIDDKFDMELIIPSAMPLMVQEDLLVIIPSVVYSPTYFYANNSTGNPLELDELREQMTAFYSSLDDSSCLDVEILKEDLYLACTYDDGYWYRVQINIGCNPEDSIPSVVVFYVDYGNESIVPVTSLRPLTPRFARHPAMSILCALAFIVPPKQANETAERMPSLPHELKWNKAAMDRFRNITENEKPLTAQISRFTTLTESRVLHEIFLWDTDEQGDRIINDILVEEGLAEYNNIGIIPDLLSWEEKSKTREPPPPDSELLSNWDPMALDFNSVENSYGVDAADPGVATVGYKATDESYVCKYYAANKVCYRGDSCPYQHIEAGYAGGTVDQESVYVYENTFPLPEPGAQCLLQVSCFMTTGHFYVVFPYGTRTPQEIQKNSSVWINYRNEFQQLSIAMRDHYEGSPLVDNTKIALAYGTIVAARTKADKMWYRARVIEVENVANPVQVFFVDFGMTEWIERHNIREMKPEFLHCPFQAVEGFLANVDPIGSRNGKKWSMKSKSLFQNLVSGNILLARVSQQIGSVLFLTLTLTTKGKSTVINDLLIEEGLAEVSNSNFSIFSPMGDSQCTGIQNNHTKCFVPG